MTVADDVEALHCNVLSRWNERDAAGYAALFAVDGSMVGFDGMVPPGKVDINPNLNALQSLTAVRSDHGWRVAHFHNTPAAFHGRPEAVEALSAVLRAQLGER